SASALPRPSLEASLAMPTWRPGRFFRRDRPNTVLQSKWLESRGRPRVRVAALYDVHGNLPALEAVLAEVPDDATIVSGGDVFSGPMPSETLARLRAFGPRVTYVRGNADRDLGPH